MPFTYRVFGRPVSTRNDDGNKPSALSAWRGKVDTAALSRILSETRGRAYQPCEDKVELSVFWLSVDPEDRTQPDIDNMLKPLIDTLNNQIFVDDRQVHRIRAEKGNLNSWPISTREFQEEVQDDPDYVRFNEVIIVRVELFVEEDRW